MLSENLISEVVKFIESQIDSAEMIISGKVVPMEILRTESKGNMLKVFTNASSGKGEVTDIVLKDAKGKVVITKPDSVLKATGYSLVASFYIRIREVEIDDPINIFELGKERKDESI